MSEFDGDRNEVPAGVPGGAPTSTTSTGHATGHATSIAANVPRAASQSILRGPVSAHRDVTGGATPTRTRYCIGDQSESFTPTRTYQTGLRAQEGDQERGFGGTREQDERRRGHERGRGDEYGNRYGYGQRRDGRGQGAELGEQMTARSGFPSSQSAAVLSRAQRADAMVASQQSGTPRPAHQSHRRQQQIPSSASSRLLTDQLGPAGPNNVTSEYSLVTPSSNRHFRHKRAESNIGNTPRPSIGNPDATSYQHPFATTSSRGDLHRQAPIGLRPSQTLSNLPLPSASPPRSSPPRRDSQGGGPRSTLPVPTFGLTPSASAAALANFREENVPPTSSVSGLGARARDSMLLPSTQNLPKSKSGALQKQHTEKSKPEAAPHKYTPSTLAPIEEPQGENGLHESPAQFTEPKQPTEAAQPSKQPVLVEPAPKQQEQPQLPQQQQQQQQKKKETWERYEILHIQKAKLIEIPPSSSSSSKLPVPKPAPQQTPAASKLKNALSNLPTPKPQQSKAFSSKKPSGIPKSSTLGVFSNIAASFSRTSLSLGNKSPSPAMADNNSITNSKRSGSALGNGNGRNGSHDFVSSPRNGTPIQIPNGGRISTPADFEPPKVHHRNPNMVYEAHDFTYWTGRFIALQDGYKGENLGGENLKAIIKENAKNSLIPVPTAKQSASAGLPTSQTTANMAHPQQKAAAEMSAQSPRSEVMLLNPAELLLDSDARLRRTWMKMESMCANNDALYSMHQFQQAYARQFNKPQCLPKGGTMSDKDPKARFFHLYPSYGDSMLKKMRKMAMGEQAVGGEGSKAAVAVGGGGKIEEATSTGDGAADAKESVAKGNRDSISGSIDSSKDDKKKGKGWVGRMFSGGKKSGSASPKQKEG